MQLLRHYHISPSKKLHGIITVLYFIKHCFFLQSIMWNCPTYDKFYIGISQRLCSFFLCTVLHHKLWFENRTALCYNKSNTRIPLFWQQVCSCREGSCGAKILKISCAWTGWPGAVGFLTPTKKRAASYPFLRGIYVAFFGCKSECADLAKIAAVFWCCGLGYSSAQGTDMVFGMDGEQNFPTVWRWEGWFAAGGSRKRSKRVTGWSCDVCIDTKRGVPVRENADKTLRCPKYQNTTTKERDFKMLGKVRILGTMKKFPAGVMVIPLLIGCIINTRTFWPLAVLPPACLRAVSRRWSVCSCSAAVLRLTWKWQDARYMSALSLLH